jgi:hypothetical protein
MCAADFVDGGGLPGDGFEHAFDFEEQDGTRIHREAGVDVVLDDAEGPAIEHFASGGRDAPRGDVGDGFAGVVYSFEDREKRLDRFGLAGEFDGDFGNESKRAFGADQEAGEIVRAGVALFAADADDFTIGEDEFERGDVIRGDALSESVRAAGVFGNVSADGGRFLARRIGSEIEAGLFNGTGDVEIDYTGLNDGALIVEIEFEDTVHAGEHEHDSAGAGECATGETGSRASAKDGHVVLIGEADDFGNFGGCGRESDKVGPAFFDRSIVFVEDEVFGTGEDGVFAEKSLKCASEVAEGLPVWRC